MTFEVGQETNTNPSFTPALTSGQTIICQINPAKFESFTKMLTTLDDESVIVINQSTINQTINKGVAILEADISELIGENIDFHILSPKKNLRLFKSMKGNNDVFIIDDSYEKRYVITNNDISIFLPKQLSEYNEDNTPPNLSSAEKIGEPVTVSKEESNTISTFMKEAEHVQLLIQNNQLKAISIPDLAIIRLKNYLSENIDDANCDTKLKTMAFLKVPGDEYTLFLGRIDDDYWLITKVNTGYINVDVYEKLSSVGEMDLLI